MEYQEITNLFGNTSEKVPRFITKKWIEIHDQSGNAENRYNSNKQIRFKNNLIEYSKNYRKTTWNLWNYYRDKPNSGLDGDNNNIGYSIKDSKSFDYKTSVTGKLEGNIVENDDVKIAVPLKYLSNFWRTLDMPLINCEVSLTLTWSKNCVLTSKATRDKDPDADATNATFKITECKLYVPLVTLSAENDNKLLEQLKKEFKIIIK